MDRDSSLPVINEVNRWLQPRNLRVKRVFLFDPRDDHWSTRPSGERPLNSEDLPSVPMPI